MHSLRLASVISKAAQIAFVYSKPHVLASIYRGLLEPTRSFLLAFNNSSSTGPFDQHTPSHHTRSIPFNQESSASHRPQQAHHSSSGLGEHDQVGSSSTASREQRHGMHAQVDSVVSSSFKQSVESEKAVSSSQVLWVNMTAGTLAGAWSF